MGGSDKTEKATPKRREEARKKGQVAKSADLNGAIVLLAALFALSATAPHLVEVLQTNMRAAFALIADASSATAAWARSSPSAAAAPRSPRCRSSASCPARRHPRQRRAGRRQAAPAGAHARPQAPEPAQGREEHLRPQRALRGGKNVVKVAVVGAVTALALLPKLDELAALVGMPPSELMSTLAQTVIAIAQRAGDRLPGHRRRRLRLPAVPHREVAEDGQGGGQAGVQGQRASSRGPRAMRRRQMQAARARMMADVPEADVVVTNPTHYAVALRYDGDAGARGRRQGPGPAREADQADRPRRRRAVIPTRRSRARCTPPSRSGSRSPRSCSRPSPSSSPSSTARPAGAVAHEPRASPEAEQAHRPARPRAASCSSS